MCMNEYGVDNGKKSTRGRSRESIEKFPPRVFNKNAIEKIPLSQVAQNVTFGSSRFI